MLPSLGDQRVELRVAGQSLWRAQDCPLIRVAALMPGVPLRAEGEKRLVVLAEIRADGDEARQGSAVNRYARLNAQNSLTQTHWFLTRAFATFKFGPDMAQKTRSVMRLRELRRSREMSQAELGKRVGLPRSSIAKYEKGLTQPRLGDARAIAKIFGEPIETVFDFVQVAS